MKKDRCRAELDATRTVSAASQTSLTGGQSLISSLTQEVESLKVIIDLRNDEISQLKQSSAEIRTQVLNK